jgi:hypothetical protein
MSDIRAKSPAGVAAAALISGPYCSLPCGLPAAFAMEPA